MARLSTHVLDTANGKPAAGMAVRLFAIQGATREIVKSAVTNRDGRTDKPFLEGATIPTGVYEFEFDVAAHFRVEPPSFLGTVVVRFGINDASGNYHVPLLVSPYGYTTYRGS